MTEDGPETVAIYARVSTTDQDAGVYGNGFGSVLGHVFVFARLIYTGGGLGESV